MGVKHFLAGSIWVVITTILALETRPIFASPVNPSSLTDMSDMIPNPFLDLSSWDYGNSALNAEYSSSWATDISTVSQDTPSTISGTLDKRHDYAMVCADKRPHTEYCQRSPREYYCSQNGFIIQKATATVKYAPCEEQCVCIGVVAKPICLVGWSGQTTCLRSLPDNGGIEFLDSTTLEHSYPQETAAENTKFIHMSELETRAAGLQDILEPSVLEALLDIAQAEENDNAKYIGLPHHPKPHLLDSKTAHNTSQHPCPPMSTSTLGDQKDETGGIPR